MTKKLIAEALQDRTGLAMKASEQAVETFIGCIKDALHEGEKVSIVGFGTFYVKDRPARNGRNPKTGEPIRIPAKRVAAFKPGRAFREMVQKSDADSMKDGAINNAI